MPKRELLVPQELQAWRGRGAVDGVPIPSRHMLEYAQAGGLFLPERNGLAVHALTTLLVAEVIVRGVEVANAKEGQTKSLPVDADKVREVLLAHYAVRHFAEMGKAGNASEVINHILHGHDDIDFATIVGLLNGLPLEVVEGVEALERGRGFPKKTLGPDNLYNPGTIDWSVTITQLASWSVVGLKVVPIEERFKNLISRHGGTASAKQLSKEELEAYQEWAFQRVEELSIHLGINPHEFHSWLKKQIHGTTHPKRKALREKAEQLLGQKVPPGEFVPLVPVYLLLAEMLKDVTNPDRDRLLNARIAHPGLFLTPLVDKGKMKLEGSSFSTKRKRG